MEGNEATIERLCDIVGQFRITDEGVRGGKVNKDAELLNVSAIVNDERYKKLLLVIQVLYVACPRRTGITSYKVKHTLESILGEYVSNGWAILAFYHLEYPITVNTTINASMKVRQQDLNNPVLMRTIRKIIAGEPVDVKQVVSTLKYNHLPLHNGEHDRRIKKANNDMDDGTTALTSIADEDDGVTMTTEGDFEGWDNDFTNTNLIKDWNNVNKDN
jgi:hypothetical protein